MARREMSVKRAVRTQGERSKTGVVGFESAESALEREQSQADARTPDWDLVSRITTAKAALARGVPDQVVRKAYGEKVFAAATAERSKRENAHAAG